MFKINLVANMLNNLFGTAMKKQTDSEKLGT